MKTRTKILNLASYDGERTLAERALPDNVKAVYFEVQRCTPADPSVWPLESQQIDVSLEISLDDGATWTFAGHFSAFGGQYLRRDQTIADFSYGRIGFPPGTGRRVRGKIAMTNGPILTSLSVTVET